MSPGHLLDALLHSLRALLAHPLGDMAVYVQGKGSGMVAQIFLYRFDIVPTLQRHDGVGVPQIVESGVWAADLRHDPLVAVVGRAVREPLAQFIVLFLVGQR